MKKIFFLSCMILLVQQAMSQNYHAVQGSSFAGSMAVSDNPAAIVNTPYPWDINIFSFQYASSTNAATIVNYSFVSNPALSQYTYNNGNYSRYASTNINLHLLNARIALNRRQAIAFGINVRSYTSLKTGTYNYEDTIKRLKSFLMLNEQNDVLSANLKSSTWIELFGTYSQTLIDDERGRLNAGITVKVTRGISGVFAQLNNFMVGRLTQSRQPVYTLFSGTGKYGYSSNFDAWKNNNTAIQNLNDFVKSSQGSASMDIGMEYMVKNQHVKVFGDGEDYYDYEWKIGVSLLDLGKNQYKYGRQGRMFSSTRINVNDTVLQKKFQKFKTIQRFNDSLSSVIDGVATLAGRFTIINPARLVVNVDKALNDNFYLNGALSLNLSSLAGPDKLYVSELSLLTITPRWETRRWGVYLPVQFNTMGQLMAGGAFKAGPLLIGVHNWANILQKNKALNGGGYLALVIRPSMFTRAYRDSRLDCPQ